MRAAAVAFVALLAGGCGSLICGDTTVGYDSGLLVIVEGANPEVVYTIEVAAEGVVVEHRIGPGVDEDPARADLDGDRFLMVYGVGIRDAGDPDRYNLEVTIEVRDRDGRDDWGGPRTATVTVRDGATPLATETFTPDYVVTEPDGASCRGYEYAEATMQL